MNLIDLPFDILESILNSIEFSIFEIFRLNFFVCKKWSFLDFALIIKNSPILYLDGIKKDLFMVVNSILKYLSRMKNIEKLQLSELWSAFELSKTIIDLNFLQNLKKIKFLSIGGFHGSDAGLMQNLQNLSSLKILDASGCFSVRFIPEESNQNYFPCLETLSLSLSSIDVKGIKFISTFKNIKFLDFSLCLNIDSSCIELISHCSSLKSLELYSCKLFDDSLVFLQKMTNLTKLGLDSTKIYQISALHPLVNLKFLSCKQASFFQVQALKDKLKELIIK